MKSSLINRLFRLLLASFPALVTYGGGGTVFSQDGKSHGQILIEWMRSKGGYVNSKLEIRRSDPTDPTSQYGIFAKEKLGKKEGILQIPSSCQISDERGDFDRNENAEGDPDMVCGTVFNLIREMKLGEASYFAPYVDYLLAEPLWTHLPSAWSDEGKNLLNSILRNYTKTAIPPTDPTLWIEYEWHKICRGSNDPYEENAALIVVQRSVNGLLIPVFDMMNHRNGKWLNTESNIYKNNVLKVRTLREIEPGEELYTTYNLCKDCGHRIESFGTPEFFREYGFVEQYPQRWIFEDVVGFEIDEADVESSSSNFTISWIGTSPGDDGMTFLHEIVSVTEITKSVLEKNDGEIPKSEYSSIVQYHQALSKAISLAFDFGLKDNEACALGGKTCVISPSRYDNLSVNSVELEYTPADVCDNEDFLLFRDYDDIEEIQTAYQLISVMFNPDNKDMCFDLDGTVQQCASYRPHYHEPIVHYTARFLDKIERVLFVGGGDSMLLHEILKYSSLDKVVGLELDQQVTRSAFKYFGSQPHWNNEKVEWWYGDACKSILMLPKEYFGTFDMVLVDLSETVMSMKVTDELDIMQALSLLLNPNGIMLKNELYFEDMADIFEHTIQVHYYDVPVICSQALSLGSNGINFLQRSLTDHNIDSNNLYIKPLDIDEHFEMIHDYKHSPLNYFKNCKKKDDAESDMKYMQTVSPGIVMIVEAENAALVTKPLKDTKKRILEVLKKEGLSVLSTVDPEPDNSDTVFVVVMKEGYVVCRLWAVHKYCAFDIYLWSSFEKHTNVKDALLLSVGSNGQSSSSYRIVAGGMFGVYTWKDDEKSRGPRNTLPCERDEMPLSNHDLSKSVDVILEESIKFVGGQGDVVVVICGQMNSQVCKSLDFFKKKTAVLQVEVVWSCSSINDSINEYVENYVTVMYACESEILKTLKDALANGKKIQTIVIDPDVKYSMGQIIFSILKSFKNRYMMMTDKTSIVGLSLDNGDTWQSNFMDRFRKEFFVYEPVFKGEVVFSSSVGSIALNFVQKEEHLFKKMKRGISNVEKHTQMKSEIKSLLGGQFLTIPGYEFSLVSSLSDYSDKLSLDQWVSQNPLEFHAFFQLELEDVTFKLSAKNIIDGIEQALGRFAKVHEFSNVGDGCMLVTFEQGSRIIIIWDGNEHIDISICALADNDKMAVRFIEKVVEKIPSLKIILKDFQPRGFGMVVNLLNETLSISSPYWA
uniref:SET domain-containing protein n=1 Tax=Corethron hystrix TaxID=216773 RepID=A0A7S1C2F9_9STRA|mmetsp:Transcript_9671/g.21483  ORF Transcript_9671/g.21483 Transcript_9671/m.21483 type:complete len:1216 (+) Transcript_9671:156-3803(+)